jgi:hypothetical protein
MVVERGGGVAADDDDNIDKLAVVIEDGIEGDFASLIFSLTAGFKII